MFVAAEWELPGAATAAAPTEAAGVWGIGWGLSHSVASLEDTGGCFLVNLDLSITHLHLLWTHGLQERRPQWELAGEGFYWHVITA